MVMPDAALPTDQRPAFTPGRDAQFELFVAASWSAGGIPCLLRAPPGPDLTLVLGDLEIGLEAKRIKSLGALANRFREADKQMASVPSGGLVVTDLSPVVTKDRIYLQASSPKNPVSDLERRLKTVMSSRLEIAQRKTRPARTFGWLGYCQALYLFDDSPPSLVYQWKNFNLGSGNDCRWRAVVAALPRLVVAPEALLSSLSIRSVGVDSGNAR